MSFTCTLAQALNIAQGITELPKFPSSMQKTAWNLGMIKNKIIPYIEEYKIRHMEMMEELGEKDDKGNLSILPSNISQFTKDIKVLTDAEITIERDAIKLSTLKPIKDTIELDISPETLFKCYPAITDD